MPLACGHTQHTAGKDEDDLIFLENLQPQYTGKAIVFIPIQPIPTNSALKVHEKHNRETG